MSTRKNPMCNVVMTAPEPWVVGSGVQGLPGPRSGNLSPKTLERKGGKGGKGKKETRWKREGEEKDRGGRESELESSCWESSVTASKAQVTKVKERTW